MAGDRYIAGLAATYVVSKKGRFLCNAWGHIESKLCLNTAAQSIAHSLCLRIYRVFNSLGNRVEPDH